ncbi:MAG: glycosyltransferase family 39 protein [Candidatus Promineifilaceae bacterium]|nr:glycosyltransferase family 39 protein [Candidatus Promineifilaceae bacterium]
MALLLAAALRFWQLGEIPPGLYRDEAYNGLDALAVLSGEQQAGTPFYFPDNNGREPLYIYLTALVVGAVGRSTVAVRLVAAIAGTLTTWTTYRLASTWFDRRIGLITALLWALTLWPVHLSRIGLRVILLPLVISAAFWLTAVAFRRQRRQQPAGLIWLVAGSLFGLSWYTYLPGRLIPLVLFLAFAYLLLTKRRHLLRPTMTWSIVGFAVVIAPLLLLTIQQPDLVLGRSGQVSIFNPAIHGGNLGGALATAIWRTLGLFFVSGDTIVRHNPPGRPLFDLLMTGPFVLGLVWFIRHWRRPAATVTLLWILVMLTPTLLAEDAPHFLRAAGILPAVLFLPAVGLSQLWSWSKLPLHWRHALVIGLLSGSLFLTGRDYFVLYGRNQRTAFWFEQAARTLAEDIKSESTNTSVWLDEQFWHSWPSLRFLLEPSELVRFFDSARLGDTYAQGPATIFAWPYENLDVVIASFAPNTTASASVGALAQGDLEPEPYPLYVRYELTPAEDRSVLAHFGNNIVLLDAAVASAADGTLQIDLFWTTRQRTSQSLISFVHLIEPPDILAQSDHVPGDGYLPSSWWRPELVIHDRHIIAAADVTISDLDSQDIEILIGLYDANTRDRLTVTDTSGEFVDDTWPLR